MCGMHVYVHACVPACMCLCGSVTVCMLCLCACLFIVLGVCVRCCSHVHFGIQHQLAEMSKWKATPFVVKRALVVEGGWLQTPWVVDSKIVDGVEYITLSSSDRSLAKALGMNMSERSPLAQCSVFSHMAEARDAQVDSLLFAAKKENDPMGDECEPSGNPMPSRGRALAFQEASLPKTVVLKMASFVTADGQRVEEHSLKVVTTPKRRTKVTMEANAENLEWLLKASQAGWDLKGTEGEKRGINEEEVSHLPVLSHPCKYQKTPGGKLKIVCSYREQGTWKKKEKVVGVLLESSMEGIIRMCEAEVVEFYHKHHEPPAGGSGEVAEEPLPTRSAQ